MTLEENKIYTVEQASELLSVRRETLLKLIYNKELEASKLGRLWRIRGINIFKFLDSTSNINSECESNLEEIDEDSENVTDEIEGEVKVFNF